jgi:serine/threonine protein kinase
VAVTVHDAGEQPGQLGQWQIGEELGRGGFGVVYQAVDRDSGESRAIKLIRPQHTPDIRQDALIRRELENGRSMVHRNIVSTFASGRSGDSYFLVMEFCAGGNVAQVVKSAGPFAAEEAMKMAFDVLAALEYAHSAPVTAVTAGREPVPAAGLVHRDIKPANVLIGTGGGERVYKVADFGLAKAFELAGMSDMTTTGTKGGTVRFMCRHQVTNYKRTKPEADVWAAAATLYYALTGCLTRDFPPDRDAPRVVTNTDPVPIAARGVKVPDRLARIVDEALRDRPAIRYQTSAEFRAALEAV